MNDHTSKSSHKTRFERLPKELRDPPVAFAAASFLGPLFLVLLGLIAGQTEPSSPIYTLAALVFVGALTGFIVTSIRRFFVRREENERLEQEQMRRRIARRPSSTSVQHVATEPDVTPSDERRAS